MILYIPMSLNQFMAFRFNGKIQGDMVGFADRQRALGKKGKNEYVLECDCFEGYWLKKGSGIYVSRMGDKIEKWRIIYHNPSMKLTSGLKLDNTVKLTDYITDDKSKFDFAVSSYISGRDIMPDLKYITKREPELKMETPHGWFKMYNLDYGLVPENPDIIMFKVNGKYDGTYKTMTLKWKTQPGFIWTGLKEIKNFTEAKLIMISVTAKYKRAVFLIIMNC